MHLTQLNAEELYTMTGKEAPGEEKEEEEERQKIVHMKELHDTLTGHIESILAAKRSSDTGANVKTLFATTEAEFDHLLAPMIETAIEIETRQAQRREMRMVQAASRLRLVAITGGLVTLCVIVLASGLILRSFAQIAFAEKAAQAATRSKSEFLANMSHEIRTPMTAILGFTEVLLDPDCLESDKLNAIHTIQRNGLHLLKIINNILDLSKIEAGKMTVERVSCSPVQIVSEVKSLMQVRADAKNLSFGIEYISGPCPRPSRAIPHESNRFSSTL